MADRPVKLTLIANVDAYKTALEAGHEPPADWLRVERHDHD